MAALKLINPLSTKKFFVSDFSQLCSKIPQDVPTNINYFLEISHGYKVIGIFIFSFFNGAVLSLKNNYYFLTVHLQRNDILLLVVT